MQYFTLYCPLTDPLMSSLSPSTSSPMAGDSVSLTCSVTLPGTVSGSPVFQWAGPGDTPTPAASSASGQVVTSTLTLSAVRTSQAGQYTCTASLEGSIVSSAVDVTVQSKSSYHHGPDLLLGTKIKQHADSAHMYNKIQSLCSILSPPPSSSTVPQPDVTVSANHTAPLYAGTGLTLTCTVSLNSNVDTDVSVSVTWTGPRTIPGERHSVMEASGSGGTFTGSLTISPLAEGQDDGQYTCSVTVSGGSSVLEATNSDSTNIDVMGKDFIAHLLWTPHTT